MKHVLFTLAALTVAGATQVQAAPGPTRSSFSGRSVNNGYVNRVVQTTYTTRYAKTSIGGRTVQYRAVNNGYVNRTIRPTYTTYASRQVRPAARFANYHLTYGRRFSNGFYYIGRSHNHWSYCRYDSRYRCNCYYDPYCCTWYYWCAPASCYYPVSYCPYNTYYWPTEVVQPVVVQYQPAPVQYQPAPVQYQPAAVQYQPAPVQAQPVATQAQPVVVQAQPAVAQTAVTTTAYAQPRTTISPATQPVQTTSSTATTSSYLPTATEAPRLPAYNLQTSAPANPEPVEPNTNE